MSDKKITFIPQAKNANKHTAYGLRLLEKSIQQDGWLDGQTAAADGEIISGSARIELAGEKFADVEPIIVHSDGTRPVIVVRDDIPNANSPRARRLSVAANKIAQVDFDPDWALLKEWGDEDKGVRDLFNEKEWLEGTGEEKPVVDAEPQIDRAAELAEKWHTATGQLWKLGEHRLLIGDCTVRENVERLMGGERARMVLTDPPYFITGTSTGKALDINDDAMIRPFFKSLSEILYLACDYDSSVYIFCDWRTYPMISRELSSRLSIKNVLCWIKNNAGMGQAWMNKYELVCYFEPLENRNKMSNNKPTRSIKAANVLNFDRVDHTKKEHNAEKPIDMLEYIIEQTARENKVEPILDLFGGSGTTIIAAHNLNRRCYAMEISEKYAGVILERFYTATGITPELVE